MARYATTPEFDAAFHRNTVFVSKRVALGFHIMTSTTARSGQPRSRLSLGEAALLGLLCIAALPTKSHAFDFLQPSAVFVQYGSIRDTHAVTEGLTWDWSRNWMLGSARVSGYWAASLSEWKFPARGGKNDWLGQLSLVPVFRLRPNNGSSPWFVEAGIGVALATSVYRARSKEFSTAFNFADHIAVGRNFGETQQHELALRFEHFSNAGIKHPNPGENFIQWRYTLHLR